MVHMAHGLAPAAAAVSSDALPGMAYACMLKCV